MGWRCLRQILGRAEVLGANLIRFVWFHPIEAHAVLRGVGRHDRVDAPRRRGPTL